LRCVDLFAGAGGLSLAAKNVGMEVVAAVEIDKQACATYKHNLVVLLFCCLRVDISLIKWAQPTLQTSECRKVG